MRLFYLQAGFAPGKHRIVKAVYDRDLFADDDSTLSPYGTLDIDEQGATNKALCLDISMTLNRMDSAGEGKYYIDATGAIMEKAGWTEEPRII